MNKFSFALVLSLFLFFSISLPAQAAEFLVNDAASLIAAIEAAEANSGADVITLTADIEIDEPYPIPFLALHFGDIGLPLITTEITINGNGFAIRRSFNTVNLFRVITISTGGRVTINDATISNGYAIGQLLGPNGGNIFVQGGTLNLNNSRIENGSTYDGEGGGIFNFNGTINIDSSFFNFNRAHKETRGQDGGAIYNAGEANISNSYFYNNQADDGNGGAIYNWDTMTITNSTIDFNIANLDGGAIYNRDTLTLNNVTISGNFSDNNSAGIYNTGDMSVYNSIISDNIGNDCTLPSGTFTAPANNIFGANGDPRGCTGGTVLVGGPGTLMETTAWWNGGPTPTYALVAGSPAINASVGGTGTDQRGAAAFGIRDIGAYELSGTVPTVTVGTVSASSLLENGGVVTIPVTVRNAGESLSVVANISGGTATNNTDYTITSSLTFNANGTQNFVITGLPDALIEGDETLTVSFSLVGAADISGNGNQTVTILDVVQAPPSFSKVFAPDTIALAGTSTLTFSIDNTANSFDATGLNFTDNLPAGITIANPANASTTCTGGTLTAVSGTGIISYTAGSVATGTSCTVQVDIEALTSGAHLNTTTDLSSSIGNSGMASHTLNVIDSLSISESFLNNPVFPGDTVELEFTISNGDLINDASNISFTNDLDATLTGLLATALPLTDICGIGSQISGTSVLSFTGGSLPAGTSCSFTVTLQIPLGASSGSYPNTTSSLTGTILALPIVEAPATDTLTIGTAPIPTSPVSQTGGSTENTDSAEPQIGVFDPAISKLGLLLPGQTGVQGERLEWVVTVSNVGTAAGNDVTITDTLNTSLRIDSVDAPNALVTISRQTVTVTYATLNVGQTVQFSIFTTALDGLLMNNTACVTASNQGAEECVTASAMAQLPNTGETPLWRSWLLAFLGLGLVGFVAVLGKIRLYKR